MEPEERMEEILTPSISLSFTFAFPPLVEAAASYLDPSQVAWTSNNILCNYY